MAKRVYNTNFKTDPTGGKAKPETAKAFKDWLTFFPSKDIVVYSDGSKRNNGPGTPPKVGYNWAVFQNDCIFDTNGQS